MIKKKKGAINGIIFDNTVYHNAKYRNYPTIDGIGLIINEVVESKSTTNYLRINPFYRNGKLNRQIEFDEYMFYLECRENFTLKEEEEHIARCMSDDYDKEMNLILKSYNELTNEERRVGHILYSLCKNNDTERYKEILLKYNNYLVDELIPFLFKIAKEKMNMTEGDLAFGYFCFEVDSE